MSLISGDTKIFGILLLEADSPNINVLTLLNTAIGKGILIILMSSDDENGEVVKMALEQGASFFFKKPLSIETLKGLSQLVVKENIVNTLDKRQAHYEYTEATINRSRAPEQQVRENVITKLENKNKKSCVRWNEELHRKFAASVYQLGDKNCYPKEILELMNEPSLTRTQVASHLQKCRDRIWLSPKTKVSSIPKRSTTKFGKRKYGVMPYLENPPNILQQPRQKEYPTFTNNFGADEIFRAPVNNLAPSSSASGDYCHTKTSYQRAPRLNTQPPEMDSVSRFLWGSDLAFLDQPHGGHGV